MPKRNPSAQSVADRPPDPDDDLGETWIRVRPLPSPDGVWSSCRVASWLKSGLRGYRLQCTAVGKVGPEHAAGATVGVGQAPGEEG